MRSSMSIKTFNIIILDTCGLNFDTFVCMRIGAKLSESNIRNICYIALLSSSADTFLIRSDFAYPKT